MSPEEAITETISQFSQQGITNIETYILTSHPNSIQGKKEREVHKVFESHLNSLDELIQSDGKVDIAKAIGGSESGSNSIEKVMDGLDGVLKFCNGTFEDEDTNTNMDTNMEEAMTTVGLNTKAEEEEKNDTDGDVGADVGGDTKEATPAASAPTKYEKAMPFLTLFHSSQSLFTLMSLLSIVDIDTDTNVNADASSDTPSEKQIQILRKVCHVTSAMMTPRRASERDIKSNIKDKFMVMERLIRLISHFVEAMSKNSKNGNIDSSGTGSDKDADAITLSALMTLATAACRASERNKVAFVRALKNARRASDSAHTSTSSGKRCNSSIALLVKGLHTTVEAYKTATPSSSSSATMIKLMADICKLISVLCKFDDFRSEGSSAGTIGVESSMGASVSSAHDHVLEFNRSGVVPILHEITDIALTMNKDNNEGSGSGSGTRGVSEEDVVALAGSALGATRVLAVNDEIVQALVAVGTLKVVKLALEMGVEEVLLKDENNDKKNDGDVENSNKDAGSKLLSDPIRMQRQHLTSGAIGLVRNLCGNDEIKTTLCLGAKLDASTSILPMIMHGMKLYRENATIQEHGCGTLAAMALRKPANAMRIVQDDGPREIMLALRQFPNNVLVQRQGALAVRNIVSRLVANTNSGVTEASTNKGNNNGREDKDTLAGDESLEKNTDNLMNVRDVFLDLGAEVILRQITGRHQGSVDEAYAALRDLGCKISMVKYDAETKKTTTRVEMFGEVKSNFRAVYDESTAESAVSKHVGA